MDPLVSLLGYDSFTKFGKQVLEGSVNLTNNNLTTLQQLFFKELKKQSGILKSPISKYISIKQMSDGFKCWRESTSTSPSKRHLGHYKCLLTSDGNEHDKTITHFNASMLQLHNTLINASISIGVPLTRWTTSEVIMIEKEKNNPRINRLRVINKYEADYNLILKFFWPHQATHNSERHNMLGENQWGGRPRYSSDIAALLDIVISDIHKISGRTLVKLRNDATACFDRMIPNLISLCSRTYEVPDNVCKLQAKTLQTMKYKVQTALGISAEHYQHSENEPIYGSGQGAGHSTTNWLFHSTPMMKTIEKHCKGCTISTPNKDTTYTKHILGFIDDKTQYANDWNNNNIQTITNNIQHAAQSWEGLLHTSGGKLEISKCCMIVLDWTNDSKGSQVLLPTNNLNTISIKDSEDKKQYEINLLQNNEPFKYLGITSSNDDDQNHQFQTILQATTEGSRILSTSPFKNYQAKLYLFTHLNPKIHYPLSCASLSQKQYDSLHKAHISNAISSMGYNRTWPSALRFGCHKYSSLQLKDMQTEATIRKINGIRSLLQKKDSSKAVHILIAWYQHASGITFPILERTPWTISYVNSTWMKDFIRLLRKHSIELKLQKKNIPTKQRHNDRCIMHDILSMTSSISIQKKLMHAEFTYK